MTQEPKYQPDGEPGEDEKGERAQGRAGLLHSGFPYLLGAQGFALAGDAVAPIALTLAMISSYPPGDLGLALAARTLTMVIFLSLGGVVADRYDRAAVMIACTVLSVVTQCLTAVLFLGAVAGLPALILLQALNGSAAAFYRPAAAGIVQAVLVDGEMRQRGNALISATNSISAIIGPAIVGVVVAFWIPAAGLFVSTMCFLIGSCFIVCLRDGRKRRDDSVRIWSEMLEGFRFTARKPWILLSISGFAIFQMTAAPAYLVLGPTIMEKSFDGATSWAGLTVATGCGALAGDIVAMRVRPRRPLTVAMLSCLFPLPLLAFLAFSGSLPPLLFAAMAYGFGAAVSNVLWLSTLQAEVDSSYISRVAAIDWLGSVALRPIGLALVGPLALLMGDTPVLVVVVALVSVASVAIALSGPVRGVLRTELPRGADAPLEAEVQASRESTGDS